MKALKSHPVIAALTLTLTASLAGFSLTHSARRGVAETRGALPDLPEANGAATLLPNGWHITPAGTHIPLPGDLPLKMVFSPDGKYLIVNTAGWHDHSVNVIDLATNKVAQSVNVGKNWAGMCLDQVGKTLLVSGGGSPEASFLKDAADMGATSEQLASFHHPILRLSYADGKLTPLTGLDIPGLSDNAEKIPNDYHINRERFVAGLAAGKNGAFYVVNTQNDTVYKTYVDADFMKSAPISVQVGYRPYACALSPDGETLAVSNWGDQSVTFIDTQSMKDYGRIKVGSHPNEMVWGKDGRLFVANSGSNSVSVIRGDKVTETIKTSLSPTDPIGSTPDALALSPDGKRLYVANADNNDVAVIDVSDRRESKVLGFIPTGWYPSALAIAPDGKTLYIGTGKGLRFRASAPATTPWTRTQPVSGLKYDYIGGLLSGTVSVVPVPNLHQLYAYTRQVYANVPKMPVEIERRAGPRALAERSLHNIKHVLYIIRENRAYDQVFGDIKTGNGDPDLTVFGEQVTPNAHALAEHYVLLDNLYANGEVSEDGHKWCDAAYATDFIEKAWPNSYSDRGEPDADERLTDSPAGALWDNCRKHGVTYRSYGEAADFTSTPDAPPVFTGDKGLAGHVNTEWAKFPFGVGRDTQRAAIFLKELNEAEKTGQWPQFMVAWLPEDHTQGLKPGAYTPVAAVASNDQALGMIVDGISHSRFWKDTAIFVIEDDAQNGPDHVDAHRTVGLVISPYVKRGQVDSTQYSTASLVHTMELILGLPPMTQYDRNAAPMLDSFTGSPDLTVYANIGSKVDLEAKNPATGPGAAASNRLDFSGPDRADPDALNAILWHALKPGQPLPAPVRSARLARQ